MDMKRNREGEGEIQYGERMKKIMNDSLARLLHKSVLLVQLMI